MLWITGIVSALKGMVKIPNIVGKTTTDANTDLSNAHLINTGNTTENTSDSNLNNKVKSVNPVADTLVNYQSNVSYISYVFSFTPFSVFSFTPFSVFSFTPFSVFSFTPSLPVALGPNSTSCANICLGSYGTTGQSTSCADCGGCPVNYKCCLCNGYG